MWSLSRRFKKIVLIVVSAAALVILLRKIKFINWAEEDAVSSDSHLYRFRKGKDFVDSPIYDEGDIIPNIARVRSVEKSKYENRNFKVKSDVGVKVRSDVGVKVFQEDPRYLTGMDTQCVPLKTYTGHTPICIFDPKDDQMISAYVKDNGSWEPDLVNATAEVMLSHPDMHFIDIGCNIGVFTLTIASLGRKVVSVDPMNESLQLLSKSLNLGRLRENVTLISNAISDVRGRVNLQIVPGNKGGSYINSENGKRNSATSVGAILMNDLIPYIGFKKAFMKMDIEGSEFNAFKGAYDFLHSVDVRYILMEWMLQRGRDEGREFVEYLLKYGFLPYSDAFKTDILQPRDFRDWPDNIFWIKR